MKALPLLLLLVLVFACKKNEEPVVPEKDKNIVSYTYTEDMGIFSNPERGMYYPFEINPNDEPIDISDLSELRKEQGISLVYVQYHLTDYLTKDIDAAFLQQIKNNFNTLRQGGCKAIVRFVYSIQENAAVQDATPTMVLRHIAQLKPIFQSNKDVIALVHAGFIGCWAFLY